MTAGGGAPGGPEPGVPAPGGAQPDPPGPPVRRRAARVDRRPAPAGDNPGEAGARRGPGRPASQPAPPAQMRRAGTSPAGTATPVLALEHAAKSFGAVRALDRRVDRPLRRRGARAGRRERRGQVDAGEDPRRACTSRTAATLLIDGQPVVLHGPAGARDAGIAIIYQEPTLFPDLTRRREHLHGPPAAAGRPAHRPARDARGGRRSSSRGSASSSTRRRIARGLSIADQQIVEIAKALSLDARVIVMDEPTAALSAVEVEPAVRRGRARCARRARRCSSSPTGWRRSSRSASGSRSCATAGTC